MKNSTRINRAIAAKKKFFLFLTFLTLSIGQMWGAKHSMTPDQSTTGSSSTSYVTTLTEFSHANPTGSSIGWKINQWNPSSLQVKTNQSSASSEFRFYNTSAFAGKITKVVMTFSALTLSNTTTTGFQFLGGSKEVTSTSGGTNGTWNSSSKTITWTPAAITNYTYFAFYQNGKVATGINKLATSNAIVVYYLTKVTLDKNAGTDDGVIYFDDNATAASTATGYTFSAATRAGHTCTGYYTASSGGTKVLNANGTFANANVSGYVTGSKWIYAGGTLKLYAQWEAAAATPTITPSVTQLDWGIVNKGASLSNKTFTITGSNLTAANLVYSGNGGYTVSPEGKTGAAGSLASQTITVTPPSTATPGTYNSTVSISGGGLSSAVTVAVKLTVQNTDQFIDELHNTTGYTSANPHIEAGSYGTTPTIADKAVATSGTCAQQHYHFVGWITAAKYEAGTAIDAGDLQTPTSATGATYYAVWAKGSDNSTSKNYTLSLSNSDVPSSYTGSWSNATAEEVGEGEGTLPVSFDGSDVGNYNSKIQFKKSTGYFYNTTDLGSITSITTGNNNIAYHIGTSQNPSSGTSGGYFKIYNTQSSAQTTTNITIAFTKSSGSVTYSDYIAKCCTQLDQINGSIDMNQNSAVLTWDDLGGVAESNPYAVTYRKGSEAYGSTNVGDITTNAQGKKTCTITGLECGTEYDFKIAVTGDGSHCDAEQVLEDQSTTKWNITYNLTNTVALSEGPAQGANACGEISASFTKNALYTFPENITVTIGGVEASSSTDYDWDANEGELLIDADKVTGNVVIAIEGVAPANPVVTPNPAALNFASVKKGAAVPAAQDIEITGQNLTEALTVTSSNPLLYAVSVKSGSLTPDGNKDASPVITVTPQAGITDAAGDKNATITISGGGLASNVVVNVTFNVQETYTVNWYVNGTKIDANSKTDVTGTAVTAPNDFSAFTDCSELHFIGWKEGSAITGGSSDQKPTLVTPISAIGTANVDYYAVFAEGTPGSDAKLFEETFANSTGTAGWSGNAAAGTIAYDNEGWTAEKASGNGGSAKLGGKSAQGYAITPEIDINGSATLTFKTGAWGGDKTTGGLVLSIEEGSATLAPNTFDLTDSNWGDCEVSISNADGPIKIKFSAAQESKNRFFLDDVVVTQTSAPVWTNYYTTCPHCNSVALSKAGESAGNTFALQRNSANVTSVNTCEDVTVDVAVSPATGYELTNIALSGVDGATYSNGVIAIPQDAEGTLTVTATFTQKNYEVALAQSPAAGATLNGATTTAHYNATINISTTVPDGYMFAGWTPANLFANTEAANAISTSFTMPNDDVTVTANFTQIYTVADALALVPESGDNSDYVYVGGLISYVDETSWDENYKNINYYISANGTRENELLVYHGYKGYDKETFDAITDIKAGDKVIVYGKLTNYQGTKEFAQNNKSGVYSYIYQFTEAILSSVEVGGTLAKTDYFINDDFTREGLTATAVYSNTGYSKDITDEATWTNNLAGGKVTEDGTVRVTATYNLVSGYKDVEVTVTTKVLESIELSETALTGYLGQAVQKPATVTAHFDDNGVKTTENVTAFASFDDSDYDASSTAEQTITVSYQFGNAPAQTADYTITLSSIRNTIETAYTVEKGRSIIDLDNLAENNLELDDEGNKVFVQGYITDITSNKYTIKDNIEDTEFIEIYEGTLGDGISSVKVGDLIKVEGNLYFYENNSHTVQKHQILNGEIVAVVRTPNLTVADVAEMEVNFTADLAEADLTIDKDGSNGDITFACTDPAVTIVNNKLHAAAAGDATVTATIAASGIYTEASTTFNVHVIAERTRYAITMDANGGSGTDPEYAKQLAEATVNLPATCPYSKANSAFDAWVVTETESGDAVAVTNGHFTMPAAAVTIKATWNEVETCHISFQVSGGEVATAEAPQTVAYSLAEVAHPTIDGFTFLGWSETEYADETTTLPTMIESYTPALNESSKTLYGIYSQVVGGENQHYVLNYSDVDSKTLGYGNATDITASDGSKWVVKAHKNQGMQINSGKNSSIKIPNCPSDIISIAVTGSAQAIGFSASDYSGSGSITYLVEGTNIASQTLDFEGLHVNEGYIVPDGGVNVITRIDVEYSGNVTYYTSSPVTRYNVTYTKGEATGVEGLCEAHRYAAGNITLCDAPTCADKNFTKWSDGTSLYNAGAEYTLSADVTFTATWTPKPKYTVTYTANGGTGTAPDVEEYMEDETVTVKENEYFSKPGFVYAGWQVVYNDGTDHIITPNDEGEFEMVAYNVTIKALWEEPSNQKWVRVESSDELATDGTNYIIVAKVNDAAMGALNGSYYNSIGIVKTGNYLNGPESMTKITLEAGSEEGKLAMKHGSKYIYSTGAKNIGERDDDKFDWTITIADGVATINAGTVGKLQFNTASPRFTTYTSSLQAVAIYREKALTPIDHDGMTEDDVNTYDDVEIGQDKTWTVSGEIEVGDVYMKEGAVIANSAEVTANDLYFKARHGKSNQIFDLSQITVVSNMYYDFQLCDGDLDADYWYSIAVPFDVDLNSGVFQADGSPMTNRVDFEVWGYDTQLRAQTQSNGWKRVSDNMMHAGKAYLIGFNPGQPNIIRLKAAANWKDHLFSGTSMSVESTGSGDHDNWNGLANPSGRYIDVNKKAEVFNNNTHLWDSYDPAALSFNFVVGTAFFVQSADAIMISNIDHHGQYRAPKRENDSKCAYAVRITRDEAESFDNQIIVRASEEATGEYTQGHDMLTMNNATSKTAAMLWTENYGGKRLAIEEAAWLNGTASYVLKMFAPAAGTYSISVAEAKANADLYLTYEGNIIWNLSESAYPIDLKKGTTEGYGLLLNAKMPMTPTGVDEVQSDKVQCTKVVIDEHVYILRGGQMYDVTGKAVK